MKAVLAVPLAEAHRCLEHDHPRGKIVFKVGA